MPRKMTRQKLLKIKKNKRKKLSKNSFHPSLNGKKKLKNKKHCKNNNNSARKWQNFIRTIMQPTNFITPKS